MTNNKQSSVEQLAIALYENGYLQGNGDEIDDLLVYFKAMHKEEMIQSYSNGWHDGQDIIINGIAHIQVGGDAAGQQYYNETFNDEQTN